MIQILVPVERDGGVYFPSLAAVEERLLAFQTHYETIARPFEWKFTRRDLAKLLNKIKLHSAPQLRLAA